VQHRAGIDRSAEHKYPQFPHFRLDHFVDMVGVTGSIPVAPTNKRLGNRQLRRHSSRHARLVMPEQAAIGAQKPDRVRCQHAARLQKPVTVSASAIRMGQCCLGEVACRESAAVCIIL
jgi:hypothetical protein